MLKVENLSLEIRGGRITTAGGGVAPAASDTNDQRLILPPVSFSVASGQILAIVGDSGAGKTSLLNAIAGFIRPVATQSSNGKQRARMDFLPGAGEQAWLSGDIRIEGQSVLHTPAHRRKIGMLMQNFSVFEDRSIADNLTFEALIAGESRKHRLARAEEIFQLLHFDHVPADKIRNFLKRRAGRLSGGERQRVALVRLVNHRPPIWLLDEPYANLDAMKREEISNDIRRFISKMAEERHVCALVVCHDLRETALADKLLVLAKDHKAPDWAYAEKRNGVFVRHPNCGKDSKPVRRWIERLTADHIL